MLKWIPAILAPFISWYVWRKAGYRHQRTMLIVATYLYSHRLIQPQKRGDWPITFYSNVPIFLVAVPVGAFIWALVGGKAKTPTGVFVLAAVVAAVAVLAGVGALIYSWKTQLMKGPLTKLERRNSAINDHLPAVKKVIGEVIVRQRLEKYSSEKMAEEAKRNAAYYLEHSEKIEQAYNDPGAMLYGEFKPFQVAALALRHLNSPDDLVLMSEEELGNLLQRHHGYDFELLKMVRKMGPPVSPAQPKTREALSQFKRLLGRKLAEGRELMDARRELEEMIETDPANARYIKGMLADIDSGDYQNWGRD